MSELDKDTWFWMRLSELSLAEIWDNEDDDVYAELLSPQRSDQGRSQCGPDGDQSRNDADD